MSAAVKPRLAAESPEAARILAFGLPDTRKTTFGLSGPKPGAISLEGSAAQIAANMGIADQVLVSNVTTTEEYLDTLAAFITQQPGFQCESLLIDSATALTELLRRELKFKGYDRSLNQADNARLQGAFNDAVRTLFNPLFFARSLPIIVTAHSANAWIPAKNGIKVSGQRAALLESVEHVFDLVIEFKFVNGKYFGVIRKSRYPKLPKGLEIPDLVMAKIAKEISGARRLTPLDELVELHRRAGAPFGKLRDYLSQTNRPTSRTQLDAETMKLVAEELRHLIAQRSNDPPRAAARGRAGRDPGDALPLQDGSAAQAATAEAAAPPSVPATAAPAPQRVEAPAAASATPVVARTTEDAAAIEAARPEPNADREAQEALRTAFRRAGGPRRDIPAFCSAYNLSPSTAADVATATRLLSIVAEELAREQDSASITALFNAAGRPGGSLEAFLRHYNLAPKIDVLPPEKRGAIAAYLRENAMLRQYQSGGIAAIDAYVAAAPAAAAAAQSNPPARARRGRAAANAETTAAAPSARQPTAPAKAKSAFAEAVRQAAASVKLDPEDIVRDVTNGQKGLEDDLTQAEVNAALTLIAQRRRDQVAS